MKLKVLGSSSAGNCYILEAKNGDRLIIDLGVKWTEIQKALNFNYDRVSALISHSHGDHFRSFSKAWPLIDCYVSTQTFEYYIENQVLNGKGHLQTPSVRCMLEKHLTYIYGFKVMAFPLLHDVHCLGFLIYHKECGTICFITDTKAAKNPDGTPFDFPGVNHFIVEANYCEDILLSRVYGHSLEPFRAQRVVESHFSFQECRAMLKQQDLSQVENIVLIHLSDGNSNAEQFKNDMIRATGKNTYIAEPGLELDLNLNLWGQ